MIILERACLHAVEIGKVTSTIAETWDPYLTLVMIRQVFISLEPPPPQYIKVNFDGGVRGSRDGAGFVIHGSGMGLMATEKSHLYKPMVPMAELRGV